MATKIKTAGSLFCGEIYLLVYKWVTFELKKSLQRQEKRMHIWFKKGVEVSFKCSLSLLSF